MLIHTGGKDTLTVFGKGIRRHRNDGDGLRIRSRKSANGARGRDAVHDRHHDIHQNRIVGAFFRLSEETQRFFPIHGFGDGGACIFQQKFRDFHIELIVFRDEEMETCDVCLHLFFDLRLLRKIECERQGDDEGAPLTGIADAVDTAPI